MARRTKKQRAVELLDTLRRGPEFDDTFTVRYKPMHARDAYLIWVESWVLPEVQALIPELNTTHTGERK